MALVKNLAKIHKELNSTMYEFNANSNKHFSALSRYCTISSVALLVYAMSNAFYFVVAANSGKVSGLIVRSIDDILVIISALYAAYQLKLAAGSLIKIVKTEGNDIELMNISNDRLRFAFGSLAAMLIFLSVRFLLNYQSFVEALNC